MATSSTPPYQLLVANFSRPYPSLIRGADPRTQGPTKTRGGFEFRLIQNIGFSNDLTQRGAARSLIVNTITEQMDPFDSVGASGDVTVADNTFVADSASLFIGPYELVSGRDFIVGGSAAATATAIDTAINNLPGYSTVLAAPTITVIGPLAQANLRFDARYRGGNANFSFTYVNDNGVLGWATNADSAIKPPTILPTTPNHHLQT